MKPVENVRLYRCLIHQPLDETWNDNPDRLSDQQDWDSYITEWGVLAQSEDEAKETALKFQSMCSELEATVQEILEGDEAYTDVPGPVWQGARYSLSEDELDDDDDEFSDEEDSDEQSF